MNILDKVAIAFCLSQSIVILAVSYNYQFGDITIIPRNTKRSLNRNHEGPQPKIEDFTKDPSLASDPKTEPTPEDNALAETISIDPLLQRNDGYLLVNINERISYRKEGSGNPTNLIYTGKYVRPRLSKVSPMTLLPKKRLGAGISGTVYSVKAQDSNSYAMKVGRYLNREIKIFEYIGPKAKENPLLGIYIIQLKYTLSEETGGTLEYVALLTDLANKGCLRDFLDPPNRKISEATMTRYIIDMILALMQLHGIGVFHLDYQLHNILLAKSPTGKENIIKIIDFGLSTRNKKIWRQTGTGGPPGM